jgi:hypothetical protein
VADQRREVHVRSGINKIIVMPMSRIRKNDNVAYRQKIVNISS